MLGKKQPAQENAAEEAARMQKELDEQIKLNEELHKPGLKQAIKRLLFKKTGNALPHSPAILSTIWMTRIFIEDMLQGAKDIFTGSQKNKNTKIKFHREHYFEPTMYVQRLEERVVMDASGALTGLDSSLQDTTEITQAEPGAQKVAEESIAVDLISKWVVVYNKKDGGGNSTLVIEHHMIVDGKEIWWYTKYLHMYCDASGISGVLNKEAGVVSPLSVGTHVNTGEQIGNASNVGGRPMGIHLHQETFMQKDGVRIINGNYFNTISIDQRALRIK